MTRLPLDVLRRGTGVPPAFQEVVEEEAARFARTPLGTTTKIGLDNTIAMAAYVAAVDDGPVLVVDWGHTERLLRFSRYFWHRSPLPLFHQHLVSYLEREVCLIAARKAATLRALGPARDYHRAYRRHEFAGLLESPADAWEDTREASVLARLAVQEQIARGFLHLDGDPATEHLQAVKGHGWLLGDPDQRLRDHLFVDSLVLDELSKIDPAGVAQGLLCSVALRIAYGEIEDAIEAIAPTFGGWSQPLWDRMEAEERRDHTARLAQLEHNIRLVIERQRDPEFREYLELTARVTSLLRDVVRDVFVDGLRMLVTFLWDDGPNIKRQILESDGRITAEAEAAILEALCMENAETASARWEMIEAMITVEPSPAHDLIQGPGAFPGSGRPAVEDWQARLADPLLLTFRRQADKPARLP